MHNSACPPEYRVSHQAQCRSWVKSRQTTPGPKSDFVRFGPKADKLLRRSECPLSAINDHRGLSEGFDRTHIHDTHVPVEKPFTASKADIFLAAE
jgi:hypothetical protein